MKQAILSAIAAFSCIAQITAAASSSLAASECVPGSGITALTSCNKINDVVAKCNATTNAVDFSNCWCTQDVFNLIFDCESEARVCLGNGNLDSDAQTEASAWHKACDKHISFTATTPPISSISITYDAAKDCTPFLRNCASASLELQRCGTAYSALADKSSCYCAPQLLTWEYSCEYLGNVSCIQTTAALSNIVAAGVCSNFYEVLGSLPNATATTTESKLSIPTSITASVTVARPTLSATSVTATSSSAADSYVNKMKAWSGSTWPIAALVVLGFVV